MKNRPAGSGSVSFARTQSGGSWVARAPCIDGRSLTIGRYDTRARAEQALTAWVAERVKAALALPGDVDRKEGA